MNHNEFGSLVDARETHISRLFFAPDRVFKLLKPVATPFSDYRDADDRIVAATSEFELNRRFAPDVYLGTADVEENGCVVDRMIVMRRLPEARQLDRLATSTDATIRVWETAKHIASLHAAEPPVTDVRSDAATAESLSQRWTENFEALKPLVGTVIRPHEYEECRALVDSYLEGRGRLFAERITEGRIRDGHGDLRAEHVFCLDDGPRVIDCLAFRDDFRVGDVLNDVAFLAMDLHRLAGPELARSLIHDYCEFTYERHPSTLAHHYVAYRAHVRAKVAAVRLAQGDEAAAAEVVAYHNLAHQHLHVGQVRLVLIGGALGVGKSTVASGVATAIGATWLRTDEVRKATGDGRPPKYNPAAQDEVYRDLLNQAEALLVRGESVVLDATWSIERRRQWARSLADRTHSTLSELQVTAPLEIACRRLQVRRAVGDDPSDATPELARHLDGRFESWPDAVAISSEGTITATVADAARSIVGPVPHRAPTSGPSAAETVEAVEMDRSTPWSRIDYSAVRFYLRRAGDLVPEATYFSGRERP